jgi:hypothetical protein
LIPVAGWPGKNGRTVGAQKKSLTYDIKLLYRYKFIGSGGEGAWQMGALKKIKKVLDTLSGSSILSEPFCDSKVC